MPSRELETYCRGMAPGVLPEPCSIVIFGVAGDLARSELIPALYALRHCELLPESCAVIGVARRDWDHEAFRQEMRRAAQRHPWFQEDAWRAFAQDFYFTGGDLSTPASETYATLRDAIQTVQTRRQLPDHVLFYLSTPPNLYQEIIQKSAEVSLFSSAQGWRRVIIEKPFGRDESSARDLDWRLRDVLDQSQLYRMDHFLGKETVQNMLAVRFANPGFEPIWNRDYIDHVQITVAEDGGDRKSVV